MYTALWYDIPYKILMERYYDKVDEAIKREQGKEYEVVPNLKNFYLLKNKE
ncbi:MAG: hypothetical protein IJH55_09970 [Romboutsia sp.]|nr:hypothetical protein [Romboutsia sp.]